MTIPALNKLSKPLQYLLSIATILIVAFACYIFSEQIGYRTVALLLLVTVSIIAIFFDIVPVLIAALLSALVWDFFFIPPKFTFTISNAEDSLMLLMYFFIALINGVLTYKIRQVEKAAQKKEEKEHTLKLYNTLLNSLSHELRTPIATIVAATDNLQSPQNRLSVTDKSDLITEISKASLRLNRQVENLLNMSRLESGFIEPKKDWCDITDLIYDTIKHLEDVKGQHKINININPDIPYFKIDAGLTEQILYNIIYNAITYTPPKSTIQIIAVCHVDVLQMIIEDNGPGFPENELKNIFDKFYRIKNTKTGGTGLGLSIVKGFVEAQGGNIIAENVETGGARFIIEIPAETSYIKNLKNE